MPGPLAHRSGGQGGPPRPPPLPRRPIGPAVLRRLAAEPPAFDHASALPAEVVRALRLVAAELRSMPRDCARDREELVFWHGRLARRLDALVASQVRAPSPPEDRPQRPLPRAAVVTSPEPPPGPRTGGTPGSAALPGPRTLPARTAPATRWRPRPADAKFRRRSEAAGQLALPV